jgi:hypothetical protein
VSTAQQGQYGLELEAQQATLRAFVASLAQLLTEYVDTESVKKNHRPQMLATIGLG